MAGSNIRELKRVLDRGFHHERRKPPVKILRARDLERLQHDRKDLLLLNVLDRDAYDKEHIPGSEHVSNEAPDFALRVEELAGSKARPVVVYCADMQCPASPSAAKKLAAAGFTEVYDFEGGVAEWRLAGYELQGAGSASTRQCR
jgi:rhodanese-related sulfurtransferase